MWQKKERYRLLALFIAIPLCFAVLVPFMMVFNAKSYPENEDALLLQQYERLCRIKGRKLVVVGDETTAFGVDPDLLEQQTALPAAVIGCSSVHGSLPYRLALKQAKRGDIIVLAPNYYLWRGLVCEADRAIAAIDGRPDLLFSSDLKEMTTSINRLPASFLKKLQKRLAAGFGTRENPDSPPDPPPDPPLFTDGRPAQAIGGEVQPLSDEEKNDPAKVYNFTLFNFSDEVLAFFNRYRRTANRKGVELVFSFPALYKGATVGEADLMDSLAEEIRLRTDIPAISKPSSFLFERDEMAGNIFLCNSKGIERRTLILAADIAAYLKKTGGSDHD